MTNTQDMEKLVRALTAALTNAKKPEKQIVQREKLDNKEALQKIRGHLLVIDKSVKQCFSIVGLTEANGSVLGMKHNKKRRGYTNYSTMYNKVDEAVKNGETINFEWVKKNFSFLDKKRTHYFLGELVKKGKIKSFENNNL